MVDYTISVDNTWSCCLANNADYWQFTFWL